MAHPLIKPPIVKQPPHTILFAPTEAVRKRLAQAVNQGVETLRSRSPISGQFSFSQAGELAVVGPATGSPAAVMALEPLLASGSKRIVVVGTCGGLAPNSNKNSPKLFDLVFPRGTISEEGTSSLYGSKFCAGETNIDLNPSDLQLELENSLSSFSKETSTGLIWTTDAPYRETWEKVDKYHRRGAVAVDMEYSAIAQLSKLYQAELGAVFVVSDILGTSWLNGMGRANLKEKLEAVSASILKLLDSSSASRGKLSVG